MPAPDSPYDPAACNWEVRHNSGGAGGVSVEVNDPVDLHLSAPTMPVPPGGQFSFIPFNDTLPIRFLGPFAPM